MWRDSSTKHTSLLEKTSFLSAFSSSDFPSSRTGARDFLESRQDYTLRLTYRNGLIFRPERQKGRGTYIMKNGCRGREARGKTRLPAGGPLDGGGHVFRTGTRETEGGEPHFRFAGTAATTKGRRIRAFSHDRDCRCRGRRGPAQAAGEACPPQRGAGTARPQRVRRKGAAGRPAFPGGTRPPRHRRILRGKAGLHR